MSYRVNHNLIIFLSLLLYVSIQSYCIQKLSLNYDEGSFATYGATILKLQGKKDIVRFESKLPITALNMLPRAIQQVFHPHLSKIDYESDIIAGRYISLLAAIILSLVIYYWTKLLYGKKAALFSFFIFLLCPNFLAHGVFVSSDIFACLFTTLCFLFLWKFSKSRALKDFLLMSLFTGLALISKFSMLHLIILIPLLLFINTLYKKKKGDIRNINWRKTIFLFCTFVLINWFIISISHLFYGMFVPLNDYHFVSGTFQNIQSLFHPLGDYLFVPFPSSYIQSMDAVMYFDKIGGGQPVSINGAPYILGEYSTHGFWYYYFVVLFYKLPISLLFLIGALIFLYFKKEIRKTFITSEMYLLVPVLYFLVYLDFFYSTQIGIRHIMIILPLLYIALGNCIAEIKFINYYGPVFLSYQFISVALYFPDFLPYTNEFIINKKNAYKKIADTNLCYGQGLTFLSEHLKKNKDAVYLPTHPVAGEVIIEVNELLDIHETSTGKYNWIKNMSPVDHIHSQYLIYQITKQQADSLKKIYP